VLLGARQHGLRRHDPHRQQRHHRRLRAAHNPLRHGRARSGHDERAHLRDARGHRRDDPHPRAQAQCQAPPEHPGCPAGQGGGHDRDQPGVALPHQLRRAFHGRHDGRGEKGRGDTPDQRGNRARLRPGGMPGEHHAGQRPLRYGGQQPQPAQGRGTRAERRQGLLRLHRPHHLQEGEGEAGGAEDRRPEAVHVMGGVLGGVRRADPLHHIVLRGALRAIGVRQGQVLPDAVPLVPGEGLRRTGSRHHRGRGRAGPRHPGGRDLCHHGGQPARRQAPGVRQP